MPNWQQRQLSTGQQSYSSTVRYRTVLWHLNQRWVRHTYLFAVSNMQPRDKRIQLSFWSLFVSSYSHRYTHTYILYFSIPIQYFLVLHRCVCIYAAFSANEDETGFGSDVDVTLLLLWPFGYVCVCLLLLLLSVDCACLYPVNQYRLQGL